MDETEKILKRFESIALSEMDKVKLMDRTDTKFSFNRSKLETVFSMMLEHYRVLEVDGKRISRYKTLYYDTSNFSLYLAHHNGQLNRYKIRHRTYVESNIGFLEVKLKNNKERTIKTRVRQNDTPLKWENNSLTFLEQKTSLDPGSLIPALWVNYSRVTFVNKTGPERITIDLGLEFVKNDRSKNYNALVIAEAKQDKKIVSPFLKIMKQLHIRDGAISKYCLGVTALCDGIKKNNFKPKLLYLNHILHDTRVSLAGSR